MSDSFAGSDGCVEEKRNTERHGGFRRLAEVINTVYFAQKADWTRRFPDTYRGELNG